MKAVVPIVQKASINQAWNKVAALTVQMDSTSSKKDKPHACHAHPDGIDNLTGR
jgi:hypothetical protein